MPGEFAPRRSINWPRRLLRRPNASGAARAHGCAPPASRPTARCAQCRWIARSSGSSRLVPRFPPGGGLFAFDPAHAAPPRSVPDEARLSALRGAPAQLEPPTAVGEYARGDVHTNGIESVWAVLKRGYHASPLPDEAARQRLAATPHPLFLQRTLVSRKRAKIGARAGPIWHYAALRGTTWHKTPPTCTRTCAFEGPLGSPRRAIQLSSREKTAHDLRVGELQWPPEDGENVTNRTVNALKTGQNAEIGNAAVRAASGERAARARLPITVIDRQSLGEALAWWRKSYATRVLDVTGELNRPRQSHAQVHGGSHEGSSRPQRRSRF